MTIAEIQQTKNRFIAQSKPRDTYEFGQKIIASLIQNQVQKSNPEAYEKLLNEAISCITFGMKYLSEEDFEEFMVKYSIHALRNQSNTPDDEVDFVSRLEMRYSDYPAEYEITYKQKLSSLLHKSIDTIGTQPLNVSLEKSAESPTVANWLSYYELKSGKNYTDSFKRSQFLAGDPHVQVLDSQGRIDIQNLLTFMDYLQEYSILNEYSQYDETPSIESLSPIQPARETMSREILESSPEEQNLSQDIQGSQNFQPQQSPYLNESASDVMSQSSMSEQNVLQQNPPKFLGQKPSMQLEKPQSQPVQKPSGTVDLSKVKLPDTRAKQTIDLKKLS